MDKPQRYTDFIEDILTAELVGEMHFNMHLAKKAVQNIDYPSVERALEWISIHCKDDDIENEDIVDEPKSNISINYTVQNYFPPLIVDAKPEPVPDIAITEINIGKAINVAEMITKMNNKNIWKECFTLLIAHFKNLLAQPTNPKYTKINSDNNALINQVDNTLHGSLLLKNLGFKHDSISKEYTFVSAFIESPFESIIKYMGDFLLQFK